MNKTLLIIQREYMTRVKKKSFFLTTILVPLIIIGFYAAIIAVSISGDDEKLKIAVIDEAGLFNGKVTDAKSDNNNQYEFVQGETERSFKDKYKAKGYDLFLYIPKLNYEHPEGVKIHSQSSVSITTKGKIEKSINRAI